MTADRKALLEDARKAGYMVDDDTESGQVDIYKRVGRWRKVVGISIFPDGTAVDLSVDLGVAKGLRSYRDMRKVLGL